MVSEREMKRHTVEGGVDNSTAKNNVYAEASA